MKGIGAAMSVAVTAPLILIGKKALTMAGDFEQAMGLAGIALGGTGTDMKLVSDFALQMGSDTVFSALESADAIIGLAKAGQTWSEIAGDMSGKTGTLVAATNLAAASDLDLASAADAVSIAMATFGLSADDAVRIVDNFVRTADASVSEVGDLTAAMANVGPTAAQFGWKIEDVNTALAILSERGIVGAEAGTSLKSMMTNLMRPTDDVTETLAALGIELYNSAGQMNSLPNIVGQLSTAMTGLTEEQRNQAIQTLAGTYGMKAMGTLLAEGTEGWTGMETAIAGAATAQEVAAAKMGGLNGIMEQLSGSVETLMIKLGTTLMPVIKELVEEHVIPFLDSLSGLNPEMLKWGLIIAGVAAAAGPLLVILGTLISAIGAIGGVIAAIGAPVLLLIAGIVAAVVGLAAAWATNFMGIRDTIMGWWAQLQPIFESIKEWFQEKLARAMEVIKEQWDTKLKPAFADLITYIGEKIPPLIEALADFWENTLKPALDVVATFLIETLIPAMADVVVWLAENIPVAIEALADFWTNTLLPAIEAVKNFFTDTLVPAFETVREWIEDKLTTALDTLAGFWEDTLLPAMTAVKDWYDQHLGPMLESLRELLEVTLTKALEILTLAWENVLLPALTAVYDYIAGKLQPVFEGLQTFWEDTLFPVLQTLADWFGTKLIAEWDKLKAVLTTAKDVLLPGVKKAFNFITTAIDAVKGAFDILKNAIGNWTPPAWLRGGSPPPLANWFADIAAAAGAANAAMSGMNLPRVASMGGLGLSATPGAALAGMRDLGPIGGHASGGGNIIININEPITVRDDRDIDMIADRIARRLRLTGATRNMYTLGTA